MVAERPATWLAFLLLGLFAYMLNGLGAATERLRSDLGVSRGVVGLHATCFAAGIVVGGAAGHRLTQRYGRGRAAIAGAVGMAAGTVLLAAGRVPPVTLAGALAMGLAGSLLLIVAPSHLADRHGAGAAVVLARANAVASVCAGVAPFLVGAAVALGLGWRAAFAVGSAVLLVAALAFDRASADLPARPGPAPGRRARARLPAGHWYWWLTLVLVV
jgi:MFS family permease